jgi:predicted metal-dependent phosphotriesterase family hydrolase
VGERMDEGTPSRQAITVRGAINGAELGHVLMHEHICCDLTNPAWRGASPHTRNLAGKAL